MIYHREQRQLRRRDLNYANVRITINIRDLSFWIITILYVQLRKVELYIEQWMTKVHRKKLHKAAWNREMLRNTSIIFTVHIAHIARTINFHRTLSSTKFIWILYNLFFLLLLFFHHRFSFSQWDVFHFHNDVLF